MFDNVFVNNKETAVNYECIMSRLKSGKTYYEYKMYEFEQIEYLMVLACFM